MDTRTTHHTDAGESRAGPLHGKLRQAWWYEQACHMAHGMSHLLAWSAGVALAVLAIDWLVHLPGPARMVLLAGLLGLGIWQGYVRGWRLLRRYHARRVGLDVEREYPQLNSLLVSYVDFAAAPSGPGTSAQLRAYVQRQAVDEARPLQFGRIAPIRQIRPGLAAAAAVLAVYVALSILQPQVMWTFAQRMSNPFSQASYPTDTTVVMITRDVSVPEGGQLKLAARAEGVQPAGGILRVRGEGRDWDEIEVVPDERGVFAHVFREVYRGFEYEFRLGDGRSDRYEVRVITAPRVVDATVQVTPPPYTGMDVPPRKSLTLDVPERSAVRWMLKLDKPVTEPEMVLDVGERDSLRMTCSPDGRSVTAEMEAVASGSYHFRWRDQEHGFRHEGPKHYLQVLPDHAPQIRISYPAENEKATLNKTLSVTYDARDDHGVAEATLVYWREDGSRSREPIPPPHKPGKRTFERKLTDLLDGLEEGDNVWYFIEVRDEYTGPGGPHKSKSKRRRVQILSTQDYLTYMHRRRQSLVRKLRPVYRQERMAAETVREMRQPKPQPAPDHPETPGGSSHE